MEKSVRRSCYKPCQVTSLVTLLCFAFLCLDYLTFHGDRDGFYIRINYHGRPTSAETKQNGMQSSDSLRPVANVDDHGVSATSNSSSARAGGSDKPDEVEESLNGTNESDAGSAPRGNKESAEYVPVQVLGKGDRDMTHPNKESADPCSGRYIYVHDLPSRFNDEILKNCTSLIKWFDMCPSMVNEGLGPRIDDSRGVLSHGNWFATNQFLLEVVFRNRMRQYECLTNDSSLASAVFVPFYAGLDVGRHLWNFSTSVRDSLAQDLTNWLADRPEWNRMWGRDHFLVGGRIAWDFRRQSNDVSDWGNNLMFLPESKNMTMLSIESSSWNNDIAIPYPTYFHPSSEAQVLEWQNKVRTHERRYLFSFAGAPRPSLEDSIRSDLINQCKASNGTCALLNCGYVVNKCDDPVEVMNVFESSDFCLQPPGDSFTRRSTFDSILAGCIPVFFHPGSAYVQYIWHLPENSSKYSVFIPEDKVKRGHINIKQVLSRISRDAVLSMREEVVQLIPRIVYADPRSRDHKFQDSFDTAVKGVLKRIESIRRRVSDGKDPSSGFSDQNSTKFNMPRTA
ncbi:probable xyloglucan galactosyltransferase GT12 [Eucalyptus grandis]|uniref:probable xyloglucan galactosyltransferase GT12 n=1 Tax=Eucalyptus grandis TaxID=71139 RepID=UPI00192EC077|nr:probable xyloglucan galactosyltransferase GT12 [Eucalyptus grandis]